MQLLAGEPIFCSLGLAKLVTRAEMLTVHAAPASERRMEDYCCPIRDEVLSNPIMLPCTHRFCFKCITAHDDDDGAGPTAPVDVKGSRGAAPRGVPGVPRAQHERRVEPARRRRAGRVHQAALPRGGRRGGRGREVGGSTPRVASPSPEKETRERMRRRRTAARECPSQGAHRGGPGLPQRRDAGVGRTHARRVRARLSASPSTCGTPGTGAGTRLRTPSCRCSPARAAR